VWSVWAALACLCVCVCGEINLKRYEVEVGDTGLKAIHYFPEHQEVNITSLRRSTETPPLSLPLSLSPFQSLFFMKHIFFSFSASSSLFSSLLFSSLLISFLFLSLTMQLSAESSRSRMSSPPSLAFPLEGICAQVCEKRSKAFVCESFGDFSFASFSVVSFFRSHGRNCRNHHLEADDFDCFSLRGRSVIILREREREEKRMSEKIYLPSSGIALNRMTARLGINACNQQGVVVA
jgi:hypothetical protein